MWFASVCVCCRVLYMVVLTWDREAVEVEHVWICWDRMQHGMGIWAIAFCRHSRHVEEIRGNYCTIPSEEFWLGRCVDSSLGCAPVSMRNPPNKGKKLWVVSDKVGVGKMMNVGLVSTPPLGFLEAVVMELTHKTPEVGGFEAVQRHHLALDQILSDDDTIAPAVPDHGAVFSVVDHSP